ncbi:molybdenum cofactor guanylyltransferase [Syntrophotalea acetylenivorans]|uniref:Probable molybdenum cofactor guanylyltransferase n=1 Tax=Syntrophotalea acetylenivorans TaxID=1842532 RepID=A0A1L3GKF6_9BACT|nr:molybdenum cofactor guanylyltransferase [Syntrophotalea acetylenivorans]APG26391.1 molybdenum cofactor guanylyltransferase [Syntrophotalea acetylenivorans]
MKGNSSLITGIILVGGKSRRMGTDKAFLKIEGISLFERVLQVMEENFTSVLLIGNCRERYFRYNLPVIPDQYSGSALGGLYTGLKSSSTELVFVAPCDMPFPSSQLIRLICSMSDGFDVVVPRTRNGLEPLFAVYRKTCLEPMRRFLEKGHYRIYDFYSEVAVRYLEEEEMAWAVDEGRSLINLNTPRELITLKEKELCL